LAKGWASSPRAVAIQVGRTTVLKLRGGDAGGVYSCLSGVGAL